jgi:hypothetical protein
MRMKGMKINILVKINKKITQNMASSTCPEDLPG